MTLIELMIAMLLGLILLAGIIQVFISSKQTYRFQNDLSRIQENGRFALHFLGTGIREGGYSGCYGGLASGVENNLNDSSNFIWGLSNPIQGFNNVASSDTHGTITGFIDGTDVLVLRGMKNSVPINSNPDTASFTVTEANNNFAAGQLLLATDCDQASLFQVSSVATASGITTIQHSTATMTPGNGSVTVNNRYGNTAEIGQLETRMYYLSTGSNGRPALFETTQVVTGGTTITLGGQELIQNVENLQFVYGEDTNADRKTDVYRSAAAVANWNNVVSVRIALLLESEQDNQISNAQSYTFNAGTFYYDQDAIPVGVNRRIRRVFTGFSALRNRTL